MSDFIEEWKPVVGFEGLYEVSSRGRVISLERRNQYCDRLIRTQFLNKRGYYDVTLWKEGRCYCRRVHRLVAAAFIKVAPPGVYVNHIDGNKLNNYLANLEYVTPKQNSEHAAVTGLMHRGEQLTQSRLNDQKVREIRSLYGKVSQIKLAAIYGVARYTIFAVVTRKTWRHVA